MISPRGCHCCLHWSAFWAMMSMSWCSVSYIQPERCQLVVHFNLHPSTNYGWKWGPSYGPEVRAPTQGVGCKSCSRQPIQTNNSLFPNIYQTSWYLAVSSDGSSMTTHQSFDKVISRHDWGSVTDSSPQRGSQNICIRLFCAIQFMYSCTNHYFFKIS